MTTEPGEVYPFVNVQGLQALEHHELIRKLGRISVDDLSAVKKALAWLLDLET